MINVKRKPSTYGYGEVLREKKKNNFQKEKNNRKKFDTPRGIEFYK